MSHEILDQMAFTLDLLEHDARSLDMKLLVQILSMASVELAEARNLSSPAVDVSRKATKLARREQSPLVVGSWQWDLTRDRMTFDPEVAKLFSIEPGVAASGVPLAIVMDAVHALDRSRVTQAFNRAISHDEPFHFAFRINVPDGSTKRVFAVGRAVFENGRAEAFPGTIIDVTEGAQDEAKGKKLAPEGFRRANRSGKSGSIKEWLL